MKGVTLAWFTTLGIVTWMDLKTEHRAPVPSEFLMPSILFVGLGVISEVGSLELAAGAAAWGLAVMAFLTRQGVYSGPGAGLVKAPEPPAGGAGGPGKQQHK